jgi:ABC-type molybdate transport system permease subunit
MQNILFASTTSAVVAATLVATPVIVISCQNAFAFAVLQSNQQLE